MSSAGRPTTPLNGPHGEWEYRVVPIEFADPFLGFGGTQIDTQAIQEALDRAGADSWELVNTVDVGRYSGRTTGLLFIFKRPYRPDRYIGDA
jgi:hypothetical protein